ncbi:guanine nucleotide-binding protein-like 3-like protein [Python bivittatus]|uniref:Guanine nucleotide-binding protein-like 3-like protein n=1 Tax=Python bivittatus TaxID=176946 RepID=A0A9F2R0X4_PYTBI|nr:guanine nucleotide-binding protein-like 3-like protein [Python bivittatus]XP_007432930.1 guanine nucleotide-binding protein-like 3-like protein [Python bivittatus]XP_025025315.1 guanine nucleotide-binding protein-like 3-like protein [Python bivittatus]XP_025025316.1 guanine nucleotide-binding protein-like 3-like protein [Python bivittatus]XP_025025317.1 guanine nucleotide-binding protein-like 3-like protein [Python bivittatus]
MTRHKQKRSSKKSKHSKKKDAKPRGKKDSGVPQLSHFKEHVKKELALRQKRVTELQEQQQMARQKEISRFRSLEGLQKDALRRQQRFEQKEMDLKQLAKHTLLEKDSSCKAYYKEFRKVIEAADVILEVLDARDPQGCRCPQVEQAVVQAGTSKRLVLVLNKIDLVSKEIVAKWLKYLRNEFPTVAFKSSTQQQSKNLQQSHVPVTRASSDLLGSGACVGADCLMKVLANYCRNQDVRTTVTVGVVGFPNVGKSSLINSLKRSRACSTGATPGITKCLQEVQLDKHIKLLDCPGIVMASPTSDAAMILRNCIRIEQLADPVSPVEAILKRCNKQQIMQHFSVPDFQNTTEFLAYLAKRQGKLKKGGIPDHEKAAKAVLNDWTSGKISYFTHPPEIHTLPTHISAEIVAEMGKAFDFEALEQENEKALANLISGPVGITLEGSGLTSGAEIEMAEEEGLHITEEEGTKMEEDENHEFGPMTIELKSKGKTLTEAAEVVPRGPDLGEISALDPLYQGQGLRAASKRRKKRQKRADKIATKLSASLTAAMNFSLTDD